MKTYIKKTIMILLACLFQIILTERPFLNIEKPFKPFISVLSPDSMKQFEPSPTKKESKFLKKGEFNPFSSVVTPKQISLLEEGEQSKGEEKLREVSFSVKCMYVDDFNLYDIKALGKNTLEDEEGGYKQIVNNTEIHFNFCYDLKLDKIPQCSNLENKKRQIVAIENNTCVPLTNSILNGNKWSTWNDSDSVTFLKIEVNSESKYKVSYKLKCDPNVNMDFVAGNSLFKHNLDDDSYEVVLYITSKEACVKLNFYVVWKLISDNVGFFAIALIVFGLFNCVLGQRFAKITSFLLSLFSVTIFVLIFSQFILPPGCAQWIVWVMLVLGIILGCTAGYFVYKHHEKFLSFLVGGLAGFFLGEFLFNLFGNAIPGNLTLIHILFIVLSIIVLVVLAYILKNIIIIFATSFIGSYCLIRGISLFEGSFPSEFTVIDLKEREEFDQLKELFTWRVYVYLAAIVISTGLSIFIQIKINKGIKRKEEGPECPDDNLIKK